MSCHKCACFGTVATNLMPTSTVYRYGFYGTCEAAMSVRYYAIGCANCFSETLLHVTGALRSALLVRCMDCPKEVSL